MRQLKWNYGRSAKHVYISETLFSSDLLRKPHKLRVDVIMAGINPPSGDMQQNSWSKSQTYADSQANLLMVFQKQPAKPWKTLEQSEYPEIAWRPWDTLKQHETDWEIQKEPEGLWWTLKDSERPCPSLCLKRCCTFLWWAAGQCREGEVHDVTADNGRLEEAWTRLLCRDGELGAKWSKTHTDTQGMKSTHTMTRGRKAALQVESSD